ncbi:hypothetical protein DDB_G0291530 [Dictyostelium discoideum AX4]|uniref:H-type lectin domain-containing protein n=1 Tax=Dictyostelium discoideum TaxID=44689 RepID=Q54EG1_DICDI|nr:hypothetical protein DDB_G0291530 [Dictyostelium discoideum AX4]EAL61749.1 hypothetical protein DDB_G0291530 [Dictyostelium discoideum AX4]|eukprot:XP_635279.1 hypothetical protein DDB_G0291530 [Dictyostelium discoideum AX4]
MKSFKNINTEVNIGRVSCDVKGLLGNNDLRKTLTREYFKIPFSNIPNVSVGLCSFHSICNPSSNIYFDIQAINITKTYFDIDLCLWGNFKSNYVIVNYTAINYEPINIIELPPTPVTPPLLPLPQPSPLLPSPPPILQLTSFYTLPPPPPPSPLPLSLLPFPMKLNKRKEKVKEELENLPPFPFSPKFNQPILDINNNIIIENLVSSPSSSSSSPSIISYKRFIGKEVLIKNIKYSTYVRDNNGKIDLSISNRKLEMQIWKIETSIVSNKNNNNNNNNDTIMILNKHSNKYLKANSIDVGGSLINSNDIENYCVINNNNNNSDNNSDNDMEWKLNEIRPNVFTIKNQFTNNFIIANDICELYSNINININNHKSDNLMGEIEFEIILL